MLSPLAGVLLIPADTSVVEGVQVPPAPVQVSFTKIFCVDPGTSVTPSVEASTNTVYRPSELVVGNDSAPPASPVLLVKPA
jgi:hypothetical protein